MSRGKRRMACVMWLRYRLGHDVKRLPWPSPDFHCLSKNVLTAVLLATMTAYISEAETYSKKPAPHMLNEQDTMGFHRYTE